MPTSLDRTLVALKETEYNLDNQNMLIRSLECLRDTVGNQHIKDTIVNSVNSLILYKDTKGYGSSKESLMDIPKLHTVIYGSPGTGKTLLAKILASIWTSIGLIQSSSQTQPESCLNASRMPVCSPPTLFNMGVLDMIIIVIMGFCIYKVVQILWRRLDMSKHLSLEGKEELMVQMLLVGGLLFVFTYLSIQMRKKYASWSNGDSTEITIKGTQGAGKCIKEGVSKDQSASETDRSKTDAEMTF